MVAVKESSQYHTTTEQGLRLMSRFACSSLPDQTEISVSDPDSLLRAFVHGCDHRGRWPRSLVVQLFWWQVPDIPSRQLVEEWIVELIDRGNLRSDPLGVDCYSGKRVAVLTLLKRGQYERFRDRKPIAANIRNEVYERDGHTCVHCGTSRDLSLDHIHPYSLGGEDVIENLQTLCRPCNSKKGARI